MYVNTCIHAEEDLDSRFDITDKSGSLAAKMKIVLSCIPGPVEYNIEEFMKKVVVGLPVMTCMPSNLSTLGQVLKLTKTIMDQFSQVVHFHV